MGLRVDKDHGTDVHLGENRAEESRGEIDRWRLEGMSYVRSVVS